MIPIAHIYNDYTCKFGIPRQSGLINGLESRIVFVGEFRNADCIRGLEGFDYIWLLWEFDEKRMNLTVRPPRLGGNTRMGVFATRSPFRPNGIGLSSVHITKIDIETPEGPVIYVEGADLMNGTTIIDIKPYIPFSDSHPEARGGFTDYTREQEPLIVIITDEASHSYHFSETQWKVLREILKHDPRPHYQNDPDRIYSFEFAEQTVRFSVNDNTLQLLNKL